VKDLAEGVRDLFLDAQSYTYDLAHAAAVAAHHRELQDNKTGGGWPEQIGGVYVARDGWTIKPLDLRGTPKARGPGRSQKAMSLTILGPYGGPPKQKNTKTAVNKPFYPRT
jgi:hypothetical protein